MTTVPILEAEQLTKSFARNTILQSVNLSLESREIKVLIGPSGGGKSTLLQCINALVKPDSGTLRLHGKPVNLDNRAELYRLRQTVGMIFQDFNLFDHLSAVNNIIVPLRKVKQLSKSEATERALTELTQVGLADKTELYPAQLSGGQKQRVAIARALAMDPEILLLDEPTSALDPELIGEVLSVIRGLAAKGMTMIMATHQISLIKSIADTVIFMENGEIVEQGTPDELLNGTSASKTRQFCDLLADIETRGA
ncbi:MAG: ABC transporter [Deltaproteobacteria bacterium]|nr:MAG: ABC transporter [Deltaproteobacteria bacterium]